MKKIINIFVLMIPFVLSAQKDTLENKIKLKIEGQTGIITYLGELNNRQIKFTNNNIVTFKGGIGANYKRVGASLIFEKGGYAQYQSSTKKNENFRNDFIGGGFEINYSFIKRKYITIYAGTGINYIKVNSKTDLYDANGKAYYYWNDGTIRDLPQNYDNTFTSTLIKRDYDYETTVATKGIILFPITLGVELNIGRNIIFGINTSALFSSQNNLNIKVDPNKKEYLLLNTISLAYIIGKKPKSPSSRYDAINFNTVVNIDSDGDGIMDINDACPGTPAGKKVDRHGCLIDSDEDGIPDEIDKEPHTKAGMAVDQDGIGIKLPTLQEVQSQDLPEPEKQSNE